MTDLTPSKQVDLSELALFLTEVLKNTLKHVLEGTEEDLKQFGHEIARDLAFVGVMRLKDVEKANMLENQLVDQLRVLAEVHRIRAGEIQWVFVEQMVRVLSLGVAAGISSVL